MMARNWEKMSAAKQDAHRACASVFIERLER
jgi:hypothetical protein